jgi:hypothetical protein
VGERRSAIIITGSIVVAVALVLGWMFAGSSEDDRVAAAPLTEVSETAAIQNQIQLTHLGIATSENFAGHRIRLVGGTVKNVSDKPIRMVQVKMTFTDYDGKPVQEYTDRVFETRQKPLLPNTEYRFEVGFENLPRTWNYRVPVTEIIKIGY